MKIAISTYSFSRLISSGAMTQLDCISKAKEMGFDAIEFVEIIPHDGSAEERYAARLGEEARRQGLEVTNFTFGADFLTGSGGIPRQRLSGLENALILRCCSGQAGPP